MILDRSDAALDRGAEWLEADGLGGFASGTVGGERTRRYHALLLVALAPPGGRTVLVNGADVWVRTPRGSWPLSTQRYRPDAVHPGGARHLRAFARAPWPAWTFALPDGTSIRHELFVPRELGAVALSWQASPAAGVELFVRPFLSGRDYHGAQREDRDAQRWERDGAHGLRWSRGARLPVRALSNGEYTHAPHWYRGFLYTEERARGLDASEDLASPGELRFDLSAGEAVLLLAAGTCAAAWPQAAEPHDLLRAWRKSERARRAAFASPLHRAADDYVVRRGTGRTIVAGYPWFLDWGRDTFIALRGLCLATGDIARARDILVEWAGALSEGMLPNRFAESGEAPEYGSVDSSLWYAVAVRDLLAASGARGPVRAAERRALESAVLAIVERYAAGTRFGIRMDGDGLLAAGESGKQLTWMDAKVEGRVVTPRIGKPVEVQALWINALRFAATLDTRWQDAHARAQRAFEARFWNDARGCLYDVVDCDHERGRNDPALRPNQILAVGGLPEPLMHGERARAVVDAVEAALWTPLGLRSLAPSEPGYAPRYAGDVRSRDGAYHQGTAWPWLAGPFVEAWVRVRGDTAAARAEARERFLPGLLAHLEQAGLGHVSEIADAEPPFTPRGCPFQAWSLGELLRLDRIVLAPVPARARKPRTEQRAPRSRRKSDAAEGES
jgi:predicted glycogen debranching enzyme